MDIKTEETVSLERLKQQIIEELSLRKVGSKKPIYVAHVGDTSYCFKDRAELSVKISELLEDEDDEEIEFDVNTRYLSLPDYDKKPDSWFEF